MRRRLRRRMAGGVSRTHKKKDTCTPTCGDGKILARETEIARRVGKEACDVSLRRHARLIAAHRMEIPRTVMDVAPVAK